MRAMEALDPRFVGHQIDRAVGGAPVWPAGLTGSITHTDDFASAAVAWTTDTLSLGIDTERVMSDEQARDVGDVIASPSELRQCRVAGIPPRDALTLVFSAKESIFKCLHPLVGHMFELGDVRIVGVSASVDATSSMFHARIVNSLGAAFPVGTLLDGHFAIESPLVHTGISLGAPEARVNRCTDTSSKAR
jgi:enterobactin synthetase component D